MSKQRKVPLRKCVVTQEMFPKQALIRIVKTKEGDIFVDPTGKKNGRGAYISKSMEAIQKAEKTHALDKHLEAQIPAEIYEEIKHLIEG